MHRGDTRARPPGDDTGKFGRVRRVHWRLKAPTPEAAAAGAPRVGLLARATRKHATLLMMFEEGFRFEEGFDERVKNTVQRFACRGRGGGAARRSK